MLCSCKEIEAFLCLEGITISYVVTFLTDIFRYYIAVLMDVNRVELFCMWCRLISSVTA